MKLKKRSIFILFLSIFFLMACSDDDEVECIDYDEIAEVTNVEAPETAMVNEAVEVTVTFQVQNACGEFARFDESLTGTTRTISVEALYEGCACAQVITSRTVTYTFTPTTAGEHLLRFRAGPDEFVEATVTVEESSTEE